MFDMIDEIQSQLRAGEDSCAEFMEVPIDGLGRIVLRPETIAEVMVAFANVDGGCIFMGVDDKGVVQGIPEDRVDDLELLAKTVARESCDPPIEPTTRRVRVPGSGTGDAVVVLVRIRKSLYCHRTTSGRYFRRLGMVNHDPDPSELRQLLDLRRGRRNFDVQPVPGAILEDLDRTQIESYLATYQEIPSATVLQRTTIAVEADGVLRPTVAGLLAFGRTPSMRLHSASISVAVYAGFKATPDSLVDDDQIDGRLGNQIDAAVAFVARHTVKPASRRVGWPGRPQYDMGAVREAVVNAVAHRDYSISDSRVRILLFADRLEIYSPGRLPGTLEIENLEFLTATRNQLLVQFLLRIRSSHTDRPHIQSHGQGVARILHTSEDLSGRRPLYEVLGEELRLTLWALLDDYSELNARVLPVESRMVDSHRNWKGHQSKHLPSRGNCLSILHNSALN